MQEHTRLESIPVFSLEMEKGETSYQDVDQIIACLKARIDAHEMARFVAVFDHYQHTKGLESGRIDPAILDAKNIVFCFGITLPDPQAMAYRPRSIGVVELKQSFVISFLEAPMPVANVVMEQWARSLHDLENPLGKD